MIADEEGQILEAHSVSAGLDYPGVGPEHAHLRDTGRATYEAVTDEAALAAFGELARLEGIIPALESAHAIAWLIENGGGEGYDVLCLSGRGDKDLAEVVALTEGWGDAETRELAAIRRPVAMRGGSDPKPSSGQDEGRAALMPYMMAGFPDHESSLAVAASYADNGADLIELGIPFSDPLADGPTIHAAATAALAAGATHGVGAGGLRVGRRPGPGGADGLREHGPRQGRAPRSSPAARPAAGAAGAIVPDLPLGEGDRVREALAGAGLDLVPLLAPTTSAERRAQICAAARGFVYVVSTVGTTGERAELPADLAELIAAAKDDSEVPVAVGFGIGTPDQAAKVGERADGVIIGSRLVRAAAEAGSAAGGRRGRRRVPARDARRPRG